MVLSISLPAVPGVSALRRFARAYGPPALRGLGWTALGGVAWTVIASEAFLWMRDLLASPEIAPWQRPYQWWAYLPYIGPRRGVMETLHFILAGLLATAPFLALARFAFRWAGGWRGIGQSAGIGQIVRGTSNNHGRADYMDMSEARAMFPAEPDADLGGVVVGEADRVDLGPVAHLAFDPDNRATWGNGGTAPLLIDRCARGSTHSMVIGGGGTYKSTTLVTSMLTWRKSFFCLDPSEELADLVAEELADRGKKVVRLVIGGVGPNVLDVIDINDAMAETRLRSVVGRIIGPIPEDGKDNRFKKWGRTIILALAAHLVWDPAIPREMKTLRTLRAGLDVGEERIRDILRGIAEDSPSPLARSLAGTMWDMTKETFSGALGNATDDTEWLASEAYGNLVSGNAYRMDELVQGNLCVFCQVPQEALEHTPAVARVLVGCSLDAVFAAKGKVNGRVYFPIDEAVLMGRDPALKLARDQGRKSKITLQLFYQSEGQIEEVWGEAGKASWFDGLSWRQYAGLQNLKTAREVSGVLGTYGAKAVSQGTNRGRSGRMLEIASASKGTSSNEHEIARELAKPHELLSEMRDDERITMPRNRRAIRHGAAIGFRRPEIAALLGRSRYRSEGAAEAAPDASG